MQTETTDRIRAAAMLSALFVWCGVLGWIYEIFFYRIDRGEFIKRGQGFGPWLPIYAVGGLLILLLVWRLRERPIAVFLASGVIAGVVEFAVGWFLFTFFDGLRLWDYNTEIWNWGNIGGYICLRSVLVFAASGCLVVYGMVPALKAIADRVPRKAFLTAAFGLLGLFLADILFSYGTFFAGML